MKNVTDYSTLQLLFKVQRQTWSPHMPLLIGSSTMHC